MPNTFHTALGIRQFKDRVDMLAETTRVARKMLTECPTTFRGKYYQVREVYDDPTPVPESSPHIIVCGSDEKTMLRLVPQLRRPLQCIRISRYRGAQVLHTTVPRFRVELLALSNRQSRNWGKSVLVPNM